MGSPLNHRLHRFKKLITQIILLFSVFCLLSSVSHARTAKMIRVAIIQDTESFSLRINGFFEITDSSEEKILFRGRNLKTTVTTYRGGILIGGNSFDTDRVFIKTVSPDIIIINGRKFRGNIQFIKNKHGRLLVINHIELEDYIKGILYHEVSHYWPMEALKAQAVVCRSYAAYQCQENKSKDYDVTSDIYSQVYGGRISERYRTNKAVDASRGVILTYQDKLMPAYYHATCGGHTEDASLLWKIDIAPLDGVSCGFCYDSPHFRWHYVMSLEEIRDKLVNVGYKITDIEDILVAGKDKSGRITDLKIIANKVETKISAKEFRNIMGPNIIRSTNFNINVINHDAVFEGFGWGHGVGLCQWGAYFMAKQGYGFKEILQYYYPGTELEMFDKITR